MNVVEKIIALVFVLLTLILIVFLILKITGHSPTDVQILYVGFSVVISYLLMMSYKIGVFVGKVDAFMNATKNNFKKLNEGLKKR
jgi:ABC-type antimicrobial peptide transport system permease subunit